MLSDEVVVVLHKRHDEEVAMIITLRTDLLKV